MTGPYSTAATTYWQAGWRGILPLPERAKKNPPKGYTGDGGAYPGYADIYAWTQDRHGDGNIALRMPAGVIGLDVDAYGDKAGAETLRLAEAQHGELPPTWRTTSRDDGVSGIRLYRVPEGLAWPGEIGPATEVIQARHRYAVVWPSVHPEGRTYRWIGPDGVVSTTIPDPDRLPLLPEAWIAAYTGGELAVTISRANVKHAEAVAWIASREHSTEAMCTRMARAVEAHVADLRGSAHNSTRDAALRVARLADEGHHGAVHALAAVRKGFIDDATSPQRSILGKAVRTRDEAVYEFAELVASGVGIVVANPSGVAACDCYGQITGLVTSTATTSATDGSLALDPVPLPAETPEAPTGLETRFLDGASFILDAPERVPSVWGDGDECLWAEGEALMLCGPPGVGKTTLTGQVVRGLLGLQPKVLGLPVREVNRVLYLAMDRPQQIARGLRRTFAESDRPTLADRLLVWPGPPPGDVAKHPTVLLSLAQLAEADVVVVDSVKDAAVGLSEDEVGAGYNRARQQALTDGVQVLELHHMVKRGANGAKPKELADVYGSTWLTAGAGSVALIWGAAGDPIVELTHLKQPAAEVGPWKLQHDHDNGTTSRFQGNDPVVIVASFGAGGATANDVAKALYSSEKPSESEKEKVRRKLRRLADEGLLESWEKARDVYAGGRPQTYFRAAESQPRPNHAANFEVPNHAQPRPTTPIAIPRSETNHDPNHANHDPNHGTPTTIVPPSLEGDERGATRTTLDCNSCGQPFAAEYIEKNRGYCAACGKGRA